jgi:hypothetical protein
MNENTISVEYIGLKPKCTDSFPNGKVYTWFGAGDVQELPPEAMAKVYKHPTVWRVLAAKPQPTAGLADATVTDAQPATLAEMLAPMGITALREFAAREGIDIDGRIKSADKARELILAAKA